MLKTLAIETSCDDTSIAIVSWDGQKFLVEKMFLYSQISSHVPYGGVVPELASRLHSEKIISLLEQIGLEEIKKVDFISLTSNPGLPGSLLVGINAGHFLGEFLDKEVIEVNHIRGHIFSAFLERDIINIKFPAVILTASGGHNEIYLMTKKSKLTFDVERLGHSIDDAAGESFDKVARMLGGTYPGGPWISAKSQNGSYNELVKFNPTFLKADEYDFSFSGMKSQVYYLLKDLEKKGIDLSLELVADICRAFQEAVVEVLSNKLVKAAKNFDAKTLLLVGGVSANDSLYQRICELKDKKLQIDVEILRPIDKKYCMDNAAMIGAVGIVDYLDSME